MFATNSKKFNIKSDYDPSLSQYTYVNYFSNSLVLFTFYYEILPVIPSALNG
jgi:hypothetical protein